jgi:MraZ protein
MLTGQYEHTLDEKNRIIIPSRLREGLSGRLVLSVGTNETLTIYPNELFARRLSEIEAKSIGSPEVRTITRMLTNFAVTDIELDKQGRLIIPDFLLKYLDYPKVIVICGTIDRLELWNKDKWDTYLKDMSSHFDKAMELI